MCESCKKFNNITIVSRWELQLVVDEMKKSIENGEIIELQEEKAKPPFGQTAKISVHEIKEGEEVLDQVTINLKCTRCNSHIKLNLDTYHMIGGVAVDDEK